MVSEEHINEYSEIYSSSSSNTVQDSSKGTIALRRESVDSGGFKNNATHIYTKQTTVALLAESTAPTETTR